MPVYYEPQTIETLKDLESVFKCEIENNHEYNYTGILELSYNFEPDQTLVVFQVECEMLDIPPLNKILNRFIKKYSIAKCETNTDYLFSDNWENSNIKVSCLFTLDNNWKSNGN
jgi:hypothetical protein